jgi:predicted DNA-binding protein with PD1-like motif
MSMAEQMEVLTLTGDIGTGDKRATASPTVEIFVTSYPKPLRKRHQAETDLQLFDLSAP